LLVVIAAATSIVYIFRGWRRDFQTAMKTIDTEGGPDNDTPGRDGATSNGESNISQGRAPAADSNGDGDSSDRQQATAISDSA
jgi:hypothetical protein